jgi:hypothetical protein
MAALTGVMLIEKTSRYGRRLVPIVGVALLAWGGLILLRPGAVTAHAGEVHAPAITAYAIIGIGVIGIGVTAVAMQRRRGRVPRRKPRRASRSSDPTMEPMYP